MKRETISRIEVLETGELLLGLAGPGNPIYEYIYRAAAGIYWDPDRLGFKSTPIKEWSCSQWYQQIVDGVRSEPGVELVWPTMSHGRRCRNRKDKPSRG